MSWNQLSAFGNGVLIVIPSLKIRGGAEMISAEVGFKLMKEIMWIKNYLQKISFERKDRDEKIW